MISIFPFTNDVYVHYLIKVMSAKQLRSCFFSKNPFGSLTIAILQCYFSLVHCTLYGGNDISKVADLALIVFTQF